MTSHDAIWRLQEALHLLQYQEVDVHIVRPIARPIAFKMSGSHLSNSHFLPRLILKMLMLVIYLLRTVLILL